MIKVRLHGLPDEVNRFSQVLQEMARVGVITIHTQSENYADRGESAYVRRYFEMDQLVGGLHRFV